MDICKICASKSSMFAEAKILDKHAVMYFECTHCGFIQTETPYWLEEAYSDAINFSDVGLVNRNLRLVKSTKAAISLLFNADDMFLDYGGGYGLFVRLMRDKGYNFFRYDPHCQNLFAKSFDTALDDNASYHLVTAFEVFEHLENPLSDIEKMVDFSHNVLFSTTVVPPNRPKPDEWWYYGLEHGQHVALYTCRSLELLAKRFDLNFYTNNRNLHLFTKKSLQPALFSFITRSKVASFFNILHRRPSLLSSDYSEVTGIRLN